MTVVNINLKNVGSGTSSIDSVTFYSPVYRDGATSSELVSTAEHHVLLVNGVGAADLAPGPVRVHFRVKGIADTVAKDGIVPDSGPVSLNDVIRGSFTYTPGIINGAVEAVNTALDNALDEVAGAVAAEVDAIKWDRGHVPLDATSLSDIGTGSWAVSNGTRAGIVGSPGGRLGNLEIGFIGTSKTATFISQGTASEKPGMWVQAERGGVWSGWQQVSPVDIPESGVGFKTVPLAVSTGLSGAGDLAGRYRVLTQFTAPITRFRLHMSTAHPIWPGDRGASTLGAVYIGYRSGESDMVDYETLHSGTTTIPAAGEWVSSWISHDLSRETVIDFQVTARYAYNLLAPAWKQNGSLWEQLDRIPLWLWIEAETYAETPTVAMVGDSTGAGSGSHMPVWDSALHIAGREQKFLPVLFASSGDALSGNTDPEDQNYTRWAEFGPYDSVIIQAGSNDVHNGATLSEMKALYLAVAEASRQLSNVTIAGTVKPRYPTHPTQDSIRIAYNDWLKTQPGTTRDVLDFSHAVAPGGTIDPVDNADGAHLLSSGHYKLATAFDTVTVARSLVASKAAMDAADNALEVRIAALEAQLGTSQ